MNPSEIVAGLAFVDLTHGHLMFVLTSPDDNGCVLVAPLNTSHEHSDHGCVLTVGDHDWIKHESIVNYMRMWPVPVTALCRGIERKMYRIESPLSQALLRKIQVAGVRSINVRGDFKQMLREHDQTL